MANVAEVPSRIPTDEEIFAFRAPPAYPGMTVSFFKGGMVDERAPGGGAEICTVCKVPAQRNHISVVNGATREVFTSVRHISDPTFLKRPHLREQGAWDYSPHDAMLAERWASMEKRVAELEQSAGGGDAELLSELKSAVHSLKIKVGKLASEIGSTMVKE